MFDRAAVDVSLLWDEVQAGHLGEGAIFVGVGGVDGGSYSHLLFVLRPGDVDRSRIETSHVTDQGVLLLVLHLVFGVDEDTGGRICTEHGSG